LTFADKTPGCESKPFSTLAEQAAQFIPDMGMVMVACFPLCFSVSDICPVLLILLHLGMQLNAI
jgi:hypothetical protein